MRYGIVFKTLKDSDDFASDVKIGRNFVTKFKEMHNAITEVKHLLDVYPNGQRGKNKDDSQGKS